jgi:hypothetical protein
MSLELWIVKYQTIPVWYRKGAMLKSRPEDRLSSLRYFVVFLSPSRHVPIYNFELCHDRLLPFPLQFFSLIITTPESFFVWVIDSVIKY